MGLQVNMCMLVCDGISRQRYVCDKVYPDQKARRGPPTRLQPSVSQAMAHH